MNGKNKVVKVSSRAVAKQTPKEMQNSLMTRLSEMVQDGRVFFPKGYSPENAVSSAFLLLQDVVDKNNNPVLQSCTPASINRSILNMVLLGLTPSKNQCYFIPRGKTLALMTSYFGEVAVAKSVDPRIVDVFAMVVYEGDEFEFEIVHARRVVKKHKQTINSIDNSKIVAAYCTIVYKEDDGVVKEYTEIMPWAQITKAWQRGQTKGGSSAHKDQPEEMAKRTVTKRAVKWFVNTSNDTQLDFRHDAYSKVQRDEGSDDSDVIDAEVIEAEVDVTKEIEENVPDEIVDDEPVFEDEPEEEPVVVKTKPKPRQVRSDLGFDDPGY